MTEIALNKKAVIYTDGGCGPTNPGYIGMGAHGYIFEDVISPKPVRADGWHVTKNGYQKDKPDAKEYVLPIKMVDIIETSDLIETNNRAELRAVIAALKHLKSLELSSLMIYSDSNYTCKGINEWLDNWTANNFIKNDGSKVVNADLWLEISELLVIWEDVDFTITWIKAHNGNLGNERADSLASIGVNCSKNHQELNELVLSDLAGYWKSNISRNPLLTSKRIYFNSLESLNIPGHYYQSDPGDLDKYTGKRMPEASYSIVRLNEPDKLIEDIMNMQRNVCKNYDGLYLINLNNVYSGKLLGYLSTYGTKVLSPVARTFNLNSINNDNVTVEFNPTGLALRAIDNFLMLDELLDKYIGHKNGKVTGTPIEVFDITDKFFEVVEKKKKQVCQLKPELLSTTKTMKLDIKSKLGAVKIPISLGLDMPTRNVLKKMDTIHPVLSIVLWDILDSSLRYAVVVETDIGIGLWSNFFSDKLFFKK